MTTLEAPASPRSASQLRQPAVLSWLRLARVFQRISHVSGEQLRGHNLSVAQFDVLTHVGADEGLTQQQLADGLLVTKGNVCQLLDRLEARGLLVRRAAGRTNRVFLTDAGRELLGAVVPEHETTIAEQFGALDAAQQVQLLQLLRTLDHGLSREPAQGSQRS